MMNKTHKELIELIGVNAVLLPVRKATKYPCVKRWAEIQYKDTVKPSYQSMLSSCLNTGVLLGPKSGNLVSIDFDNEEALASFKRNNKHLTDTLQTKGNRGQNFWFIIEGEYPEKTTLLTHPDLGNVGEWRSGGGQTIIQGIHKDTKKPYTFLKEVRPKRIQFNAIEWGEIEVGSRCYTDDTDNTDHTDKYIREGNERLALSFAEKLREIEKAEEELERNKGIETLYNRFIKTKINVARGTRNSQLVASVSFLYHAVGEDMLEKLMEYFWRLNQDVFNDSLEQHMREVKAHKRAVSETFLQSLSYQEKEKYKIFDGCPRQQAAFRILRDLSKNNENRDFFMSMNELGERLGKKAQIGSRVLTQLRSQKVIEVARQGKQWKSGQKGQAGEYRYTAHL